MKNISRIECYLCGEGLNCLERIVSKENIRHQAYGKDKTIVKCKSCGLVQLIPQWTKEDLAEIYKDYYKPIDFKGYVYKERDCPLYIDKYLTPEDKILEIGCGKGSNVRRLIREGYDIVGIDVDKSVCDNKFILNLDINEFSDKSYKNKFNVVYAIHLLEHINDPIKFFDILNHILKKNGSFILEFPNIDEPLLTLWKNKEFSKFYYRPDHVFFYNKKTISKILNWSDTCKFKIILKQNYGLWNHLNWFFRNKPSNVNYNIPILDNIYKWFLTRILKISDTIIIIGEKNV
jgi:2-polyprenyl-3-methyl-5-hydroxy-6-metoxy-1,4-benzoquinol methylase